MVSKGFVVILVSLVLVSCITDTLQVGMSPYDRAVSSKFNIVFRGNNVPSVPSVYHLEKALAEFITVCDKSFGVNKCYNALSGITIIWWDKIVPRPVTGELNTAVVYNGIAYSGLTTRDGVCRVAWRGKIFRSAFIHELMHVVAGKLIGDWDENHKIEKVWAVEEEVNKVLAGLDI